MGSHEQDGPVTLVARLHATLDALLDADLHDLPQAALPDLVTGLVRAGHRLVAAQLDAVGALDASGLPAASRHRSTARWVEARTRVGAGAAGGLVRQARAVRDHLPATRDALAAGQVSAQHVGAICHVVGLVGVEHARAAEPILLGLAKRADPGVVRRAAAHLHATLDAHAAQAALDRTYERRGVTLSVAHGRAYLDGVLDLEAAEVLQSALMPLMTPGPGETRTAPQRRADALVDLARRALDTAALPALGGARPHLTVVVDAAALGSGRGAVTLPWTGAAVPVATVARWGCDARLTFCDAHHVVHWSAGGATDLDNLVLLCRHHHRTLHTGHWHLTRPEHDDGPAEEPVHNWVAVHPDGHTTPLQTATDRSPPLQPTG